MSGRIKLRSFSKDDYEEACLKINTRLKSLPKIKVAFNLEEVFRDLCGEHFVNMNIISIPLVNDNDDYVDMNAIVFDIKPSMKDSKDISGLLKTKKLTDKVYRSLIKDYEYVYEEPPESLEEIYRKLGGNEAITESILGTYYDTRYIKDENCISTHDIYSGRFKGKGLMTSFFKNIGEVVDFSDLNYISFSQIEEDGTKQMFKKILKSSGKEKSILEKLETEYMKSPLMRLLYRIGFGNIEIFYYDYWISEIRGYESKNLDFKLTESTQQ